MPVDGPQTSEAVVMQRDVVDHRPAAATGPPPPRVTVRRVAVSFRGPGQSSVRPFSRAAAGRCVLTAAAARVARGVVSA